MAKFKEHAREGWFPKIEIEFGVGPGGYRSNPRGEFPSPITIRRKMGRAGHMYERYVQPHELLSSTETALILKTSLRYLYWWVEHGKLKPKRVKDRLFFVSSDVQELARKRGVHPIPENPKWEKKLRETQQKGLLFVEDADGCLTLVG
jgi:hypothetical protein